MEDRDAPAHPLARRDLQRDPFTKRHARRADTLIGAARDDHRAVLQIEPFHVLAAMVTCPAFASPFKPALAASVTAKSIFTSSRMTSGGV